MLGKIFRPTLLVLLGFLVTSLVEANSPVPASLFSQNPLQAAQGSAPLWWFASGTCLPESATLNGQQNPGNAPDNCNIDKLNNNCPTQPAWQGPSTFYGPAPTYYMVRWCSADSSWRVLYDLYFTKDTGHRHDWEWVVAIWKSSDGGNNFIRDVIIMEQDGHHSYISWPNIQNTFQDTSDWNVNGQMNLNHPKIYVAKWHHSIHHDKYTTAFKNTCPPTGPLEWGGADYRTDDYQFWAGNQIMIDGHTLNEDWDWGMADSGPWAFESGKKYDICNLCLYDSAC